MDPRFEQSVGMSEKNQPFRFRPFGSTNAVFDKRGPFSGLQYIFQSILQNPTLKKVFGSENP